MLPNKDLLTPGPWIVNGNTVKDAQGRTIAVCFARNATAHAYWVAEIPKLATVMDRGLSAHEDEVALLKDRVTALERENAGLYESREGEGIDQWELDALEGENDLLKREVAELRERVKSLENQSVGEK